jgi:hypothetical protein
MSSAAQIIANVKNAFSSTGPRTPEGKTTSSQNSITHALTGGFRVLPQEDQKAYDAQVLSYMSEFKPRGEHQTFCVEMMVQARWEITRTNRLEVEVVARMSKDAGTEPASADAVIADAIIAKSADALKTLKRYAASAERTYLRFNRELAQARKREEKENADNIWAEASLRAAIRLNAEAAARLPNEPIEPLPPPFPSFEEATAAPSTGRKSRAWRR